MRAITQDLVATVTISGAAVDGNTLTASVSNSNVDNPNSSSWQWQWVDGETSAILNGKTGNTYTLGAEDIGNKLNVRASYPGYEGNVTSGTPKGPVDPKSYTDFGQTVGTDTLIIEDHTAPIGTQVSMHSDLILRIINKYFNDILVHPYQVDQAAQLRAFDSVKVILADTNINSYVDNNNLVIYIDTADYNNMLNSGAYSNTELNISVRSKLLVGLNYAVTHMTRANKVKTVGNADHGIFLSQAQRPFSLNRQFIKMNHARSNMMFTAAQQFRGRTGYGRV